MDLKTIQKLEFDKICDILQNYAITYIGKNYFKNLKPMYSKTEIEKATNQTTEASILLYRKGNIPITEIENITAHIKMLNSSSTLSAKYLLDLANIFKISRTLKEYYLSTEIDMSEFCNLTSLFENLYTNIGIEKNIYNSILDENTISDDASSTLSSIRKNIKNKEQEIRNKLNNNY